MAAFERVAGWLGPDHPNGSGQYGYDIWKTERGYLLRITWIAHAPYCGSMKPIIRELSSTEGDALYTEAMKEHESISAFAERMAAVLKKLGVA